MRRRRWIAATVSALALASLVSTAAALIWRARRAASVTELALAVGPHLDFDARLSGGFAPRADRDVRRSAVPPSAAHLPPDARIVIAQIEKRAAVDRSPAALGALGAAHLVAGDVDAAIAMLEEATALVDTAPVWNDLSAAYLVKAERAPARRIEYVARGLEAASRSLRLGSSNEARFNRALALEALGAFVGPTGGWSDYLNAERDARWVAVAKRRAASLSQPNDVRASWEERKAALRTRLAAGDATFVTETARLYPEPTLEYLDQDVIVAWSRAETSSDAAAASVAAKQAALLADAVLAAIGDAMPKQAIARLASLSGTPAAVDLARAHLAYADAVSRFRADDYTSALRAADLALDGLRRAQSPYWTWAALQKAMIFFRMGRFDRAEAALTDAEAFARRGRYPTLLGRTLRERGLSQSKQWRLTEALTAFLDAARAFEGASEREDAVVVYSLIADALRSLGEHHESWEYIGKTLGGLDRMRTPLRRYRIFFSASLFASTGELYEAALVFQDAAVREAKTRGGALVIEALTHRATILVRRGEQAAARRDLADARSLLDGVSDSELKRWLKAETEILIAELDQAGRRPPRIDGLDDALQFFSRVEPSFVPRLYLGLARAHLAGGAADEAETAFADGIAALEGQQARLDDEALKVSYFDESWSLYPEMIEFLIDVRHDPATAFEYAERSRARSLAGRVPRIDLDELRRRLPESTTLVYYVTLSERLLTWTVAPGGAELVVTKIRRGELARLVARFRAPLADDRAEDASAGAALFDVLVRPIAKRLSGARSLVFVPDAELQQLPFATLRDPAAGRFLVEDHAILESPSASFFAGGLAVGTAAPRPRIESALLVGNPLSGSDSQLPALPGAEAEVAAAARFYPKHELLVGAAATKAQFLRLAPANDVVHFGGHALANPEYPLLSRLSFSPDQEGRPAQSLFAHEISRLRFNRTRVVVLGACSTAVGAVSRGEGVVSVARPFLAAGVPTVVASQWDVNDRAAEQLLLVFHRALSQTQDPVTALQIAQLSLLHGGNAVLASPGNWGAFVALGRAQ